MPRGPRQKHDRQPIFAGSTTSAVPIPSVISAPTNQSWTPASTVVQAGGLTMLILGLTLEREVPVSNMALGGVGDGGIDLATGPTAVGTGVGWGLTLTE